MSYNPFTLKGKKILITGASSGIGKATAIECSRMGAKLIITGRNSERLNDTYQLLYGSDHQQIIADLNEESEIRNLIDQLPKLDGLVLAAGVIEMMPFLFTTTKKIEKIYKTNLLAPITLLRELIKKKKNETTMSVVALSSLGGIDVSMANSVYGSGKAALSSFMQYAALELSNKKIRINSICPGMVWTPMIHHDVLTEEQLLEDEKNYPLKRYGKPEDIAYAAIYFLSDASEWVTGTNFIIDGGLHLK